MARPDLKPRKTPRQQRSLATVEVILEAAARVLARESLVGFNTNRVAEVAGLSVGSVYQYFPNKGALVTALIERAHDELAEALQRVAAQVEGKPLADTLRALAHLAVRQQYANPLLAAALDHEEMRLPLQGRLKAAHERILAHVAGLLARHAPELAPDLPAAAARDCLSITKALVEADAGVAHKPPPDLEERIVRALTGYLTVAARPPPAPGA